MGQHRECFADYEALCSDTYWARIRGMGRMRSAFIYPDDSRWRAALARTRHDVYHLPEYATLCGKHENGEPDRKSVV